MFTPQKFFFLLSFIKSTIQTTLWLPTRSQYPEGQKIWGLDGKKTANFQSNISRQTKFLQSTRFTRFKYPKQCFLHPSGKWKMNSLIRRCIFYTLMSQPGVCVCLPFTCSFFLRGLPMSTQENCYLQSIPSLKPQIRKGFVTIVRALLSKSYPLVV